MKALNPERTGDQAFEDGMAVRRRILGEEYVAKSSARVAPHNQDFIDMIVRVGWGEVWTRPGFDYRTRRILVMGTMVAIGAYEEFVMHLRAALEDGFSLDDVKETLMQQAVYVGAPRVNHAFHLVDKTIEELLAKGVKINGYK
jgi:alkylhydroperoxidase/carboxymuconolactone decarboxylase family protein YurZ